MKKAFKFGDYEVIGRYTTLFHFLQNGPKYLTTRGLMAIYLSNKYRLQSRTYNSRYFRIIIDYCIDFLREKGYLQEKKAVFIGKYLCPLFNKTQQCLLMNLASTIADSHKIDSLRVCSSKVINGILEEHWVKIQERIKSKAKRD